jgi:hypothetical protein
MVILAKPQMPLMVKNHAHGYGVLLTLYPTQTLRIILGGMLTSVLRNMLQDLQLQTELTAAQIDLLIMKSELEMMHPCSTIHLAQEDTTEKVTSSAI